MKILVLLLFVLAAQQLLPFVASRILMKSIQPEVVQRSLLSEEPDDKGNGMETEMVLPDESDGAKSESLIKEEKKRSKQQEDLVMEVIEEFNSKASEQMKDQEDDSSPSDIREDELHLDGKEESWMGGEAKKEREQDATEIVSRENERSDLMAQEEQQEEADKQAKVDGNILRQPTKDKISSHAVEDAEDQRSLLGSKEEHDLDDFLLEIETTEEKDGSSIPKDAQGYTKLKYNRQNGGVKAPKKAEKLRKDKVKEKFGSSSDILDDETTKSIEHAGDEALVKTKEKIKGRFKGSTSKRSDDEDLAGVMTMEIPDEETIADLFEQEMQGGVNDLTTSGTKGSTDGWKAREMEDDSYSAKYSNAKKTRVKDKEKPWKNLKTQKKPKVQILQEADSELTGSDASGNETKKTKQNKNQSESKEWLDVHRTKSSDLHSEPGDREGNKSQMKKVKKLKSDMLKKERESHVNNEKNFKVIEKKIADPYRATEEFPKKLAKKEKLSPKEEERSSRKAEKKEELSTDNIVEVDANENQFKKGENNFPTVEMKEDKLDLQTQGMTTKGTQEKTKASSAQKSADSSTGVDEDDDEYEFNLDFSDLPTKLQDTALKVVDRLSPNLQKLRDTSKTYFNKANQQITESFSPLVGKQFAPFFASLLSYGLLLAPLVVVILVFEHIRTMLSLQKVLLFVNTYLAAYFATLLLATIIMGEPMTFFYRSSANGYVHLQLLQALGYIIYLILQTIDVVSSCSSEACTIKVTATLQWFVAVTIGFHYYVTVFHRAMVLKGPHTNWRIYGMYSSAFVVLSLFARIRRVKKGYFEVGQADTDKKQ